MWRKEQGLSYQIRLTEQVSHAEKTGDSPDYLRRKGQDTKETNYPATKMTPDIYKTTLLIIINDHFLYI